MMRTVFSRMYHDSYTIYLSCLQFLTIMNNSLIDIMPLSSFEFFPYDKPLGRAVLDQRIGTF